MTLSKMLPLLSTIQTAIICLLAATVRAVDPLVKLDYASYKGNVLGNGVSQWLGIRFAAAPVGNLRFIPPQDPPVEKGEQAANAHGAWCLAQGGDPDDKKTSEDCLFLDVYAPSSATQSSKLPVFLYIQGGGFRSNSSPNLNGTGLISGAGNNSMIVITINYRVGAYGFLTAPGVTPNIGLLDQRKALEWVQRHISHFGGDPAHVVIGGSSAGAASVSYHLVAYGGRNMGLFHGAAAGSVSFATVLTVDDAKYQYENLATRLGCDGEDDPVACLRGKPAKEIQERSNLAPFPGTDLTPIFMWGPVVDGDLITQRPYDAYRSGNFIRVPLIIGDDTNGGTIFAPKSASSRRDSERFLRSQFPYLTPDMLSELSEMYPNTNEAACPVSGCWWRQTSTVYGDMRYTCPGLYINSVLSRSRAGEGGSCPVPDCRDSSWAYLWNVEDPKQMADGLGVPHTTEVAALFGPGDTSGGPGSAPTSYLPGQVNSPAVDALQAYWASFIRTLNPNTYRGKATAEWKTWTDAGRERLVFGTGGKTEVVGVDDGFMAKCTYFKSIGSQVMQ